MRSRIRHFNDENRMQTRYLSVGVIATVVQIVPNEPIRVGCLRCRSELDLQQPNPDVPDQLLGCCHRGCDDCGAWHVLNASPEGTEAVVVLLPSASEFREAFLGHATPANQPWSERTEWAS